MARLLAFAVGLLLLFAIIGLTAPDRNQTLETARYLDGHADATRYELAIRNVAAAEALNRQRTQHATLRIAIIAGSGAGTIIGVAFAVAHSRRPRYLPPPKVLNGYDYRRLEDWGGGND